MLSFRRNCMNMPAAVDLDVLGKLLSLAKSLDDAFRDNPKARAIERVLIRTTPEGHLAFQAKGGHFWRFVTITLPGREKEYDLGKNFANLQSLFQALSGQTENEIRRAAQGMAMYGETVIDTRDAVSTLRSLEQTLNSLIDHIITKKLRRQTDEERKKSIRQALDAMKIAFKPQSPHVAPLPKEPKRQNKRKAVVDLFTETHTALESKIQAKNGYLYEASYLRGRLIAFDRCKKELMLWLEGASLPSKELLAFGDVKNLLNEWDRETPELSQLKQQAHDGRHLLQSALASIQERLQKLQVNGPLLERHQKGLLAIEEKLLTLLREESDGLLELFRRAGEHYLLHPQQFQLEVQDLVHAVTGRKKLIQELVKGAAAVEDKEIVRRGSSRKKE